MKHQDRTFVVELLLAAPLALLTFGSHPGFAQERPTEQDAGGPEPLPVEYLQIQGLRRAVRFYQPEHLAPRPALVVALHGGGGDGERFRLLTNRAFEPLAEQHGFILAYPDALGGQWNGCRARAAYHAALAGVDDIAFLRAVARRAQEMAGGDLAGAFVIGYSNGGHLVFRLALEAPDDFDALATVGAHLPVPEERACNASDTPVSIFLVSGTEDPINPWAGGEVRPPGGASLGRVLSGEATAEYFRTLAGTPPGPTIQRLPDRDPEDGVQVETRRWNATGRAEVVMMVTHGGGHTLPHPAARFPADLVGRTGRDLDGAGAIWDFFERHLRRG
jgi:polyhydroxybutyrate depolymerase